MTPRQQLAAAFKSAVLDRATWRSVGEPPAEGCVTLVAMTGRTAAAVFRNGKWTNGKGNPLRFEPTHWADFNDAP